MKIVLGPLPCKSCRRLVVWAGKCGRSSRCRQEHPNRMLDASSGRLHRCRGLVG